MSAQIEKRRQELVDCTVITPEVTNHLRSHETFPKARIEDIEEAPTNSKKANLFYGFLGACEEKEMKDAVKALRNGRNTLAVSKLTEILSKSKQSPDDEVDNVAVGSRPSSILPYGPGERMALVINILTGRPGAEKDTPKLKVTLEKCGFIVQVCEPNADKKWTKQDITKSIDGFKKNIKKRKQEGTTIGAILIVAASHGSDVGTFHSSNGELIYLDTDIIGKFITPTFHGIPKVVLANFCRGNKRDFGHGENPIDSDDDTEEEKNSENIAEIEAAENKAWLNDIQEWWQSKMETKNESDSEDDTRPKFSDLIVAFSSYDGHKSNRDPKTGTWFLQEFCEAVKSHASQKPAKLEDILKIACEAVMAKKTVTGRMQTPTIKITGFKSLEIKYTP